MFKEKSEKSTIVAGEFCRLDSKIDYKSSLRPLDMAWTVLLTKDDSTMFVGSEIGHLFIYDVKMKKQVHSFGKIHTSTLIPLSFFSSL